MELVADIVVSRDGTRLVVERSGTGPPLVLVHGAAPARDIWADVLPLLATQTTVYVVHRRGWGGSGDGPAYSLEREAEDLRAVLDWIGEPVTLHGASFGGRCVLEAVIRSHRHVERLIIHEPTVKRQVDRPLYERLDALLAAGERDAAVEAFLRGVPRLSDAEIARRRQLPEWQGRVAGIHLVVRGGWAVEATPFPLERLGHVPVPALLLVGGDSTPVAKGIMQQLADALPNNQLVALPGQGHFAMQTAPDLYARELLAFLTAVPR